MKILIVDDNAEDRKILYYYLHSLGGEILEATDGAEGLEAARSERPDLIISDALMPNVDGFEFLREVRRSPELFDIPFIFYSAVYSGYRDVEFATSLGADGFLIKPLEPEEFLKRLKSILGGVDRTKEKVVNELLEEDEKYLRKYSQVVAAQLEEKVRKLEVANRNVSENEEELKNALIFNKHIIDSAQEGIMVYDRELRYQLFNPFMENLSGLKASDVVGKRPSDLFPFLEESGVVGDLKKVLSGEKVKPREFQDQVSKSGRSGWVIQTNAPLLDSKGEIIGILGIVRDITEQKKTTEQLHQAQKMESVGRLAGGVAHDFNNLLTIILGCTFLSLAETDPSQPLHEYLLSIQKAGEKSAELTQQLLAFARKQTIIPEVLDLNKTLAGMIKILKRLIGEDINLTWLPDTNLWLIKADPSQIDQILANLCVNARDAIADIGTVTIETGNSVLDRNICADHEDIIPGEYVRLSVSDSGCGMDKETLGKIFEPFFTTKEMGKGTGLGLATVYGAVKQNKGFLDVSSEPGSGTTFTIYLPRYLGKDGDLLTEGEVKLPPHGNETILLVEDEPKVLEIASIMLTNLGYTLLTANSPAEAIRVAAEQEGKFQLLMTDVIMPEKNGVHLAKELQTLYPHVKALFMSGYTADIIAKHGVLDDKGVHFIRKPFVWTVLATKLREILESEGSLR